MKIKINSFQFLSRFVTVFLMFLRSKCWRECSKCYQKCRWGQQLCTMLFQYLRSMTYYVQKKLCKLLKSRWNFNILLIFFLSTYRLKHYEWDSYHRVGWIIVKSNMYFYISYLINTPVSNSLKLFLHRKYFIWFL